MARKPLDLSNGTKTCPQCKLAKPLSMYYRSHGTMHGFAVYCKECSDKRHKQYIQTPAQKVRAAERAREWRQKNPQRVKDHDLLSHYGIPYGTYDRMLAEQHGACAICKSKEAGGRGRFHVDHCHSQGHIRGLLCHGCNVSIGHFNHSPYILQAAIDYLNRTSR